MPNLFTFDTETHLIKPGVLAPKVVCVAKKNTGEEPQLWLPREGTQFVREVLADPNSLIIGQNIAYDFGVLCAYDETLITPVFEAYAAGRIRDTRVREKLIALARGELQEGYGKNKALGFSMEDIVKRRFHRDLSAEKGGPDAWRMRYSELDGKPIQDWPKEAREYPLHDVDWTERIYLDQCKDTDGGAVLEDGSVINEQEQTAAAWCLHLMGVWGVRTDGALVEDLARRLLGRVEAVKVALTAPEIGIYRPDLTQDKKRLQKWVSEAYADAPPRTEKGGVSTSKETLEGAPDWWTAWNDDPCEVVVKESDKPPSETAAPLGRWDQPTIQLPGEDPLPILKALASISADDHNHNTYIPALQFGTHAPINAGWNELLETGRTSCWKPNWQNMPKEGDFRRCVIPRPGWVLVDADYSTIELCCLAQVCLDLFGFSKMGEHLQAGEDLHIAMGAELLGIPYAEALARYKEGDQQVADARQMSKPLNFGFPGGMGAATFVEWAWKSYRIKFAPTYDEAVDVIKAHKRTWLRKFPEMQDYFRHVGDLVEAAGGTAQVQQLRSGRLRGGVGYCDGCNGFFQGLAADGLKASMFYLAQECYTGTSELWHGPGKSPCYGVMRPIIEVHDEILAEAIEEYAPEAADRMAVIMIQAMQRYTPDIPIKVEPTLARRWEKKAKTLRNADGRLLVWEGK